MPGPHPQGADLLGFLEQARGRADQPELAPVLDPEGNKYRAHWQQGLPLYHKTSVTVHAHPDLGVDGRLGAYECVRPGWQLKVLLTHVPFGEETKDFLDALSLAYGRLSLLATTIVIGELNAAPTEDDHTGPPTTTDIAVRDTMHQLVLTDLTAGLTGTPSHYPQQAGTYPSCIDTCYRDATTVRVHEATYGDLPPAGRGHRPLYIDLIIPNLRPPAATLPDDTLQPTLRFPAEDHQGSWHRYNRVPHAILRRPDAATLNTAMRRAAQACGMERDTSHTGAPPDLTLQQLVHDMWTTKEELATLLHPSTPGARDRDADLRAHLPTRSHQLQEWHAHRIAAAAQERERYGRYDTLYKSLQYISRVLEDTGRRTIHAVRNPRGGPHQRSRRRPPGGPGQLPGTTRGRPPRARPPYQKHHPRTCAQGLQPGTASRHRTRPLQHHRAATRPRPPKKGGRTWRQRTPSRSVPTPHPARQALPGSPPVGHGHGHHTHPP